jgi:hypothetical protein
MVALFYMIVLLFYLSSCVEYALMFKVSYHAVKGVRPQCSLGRSLTPARVLLFLVDFIFL